MNITLDFSEAVSPLENEILKKGNFYNQINNPLVKVLALSWKQPFGTAMLYGKIETRTWQTNYRGWVLICTSKQAYSTEIEQKICGKDLFLKMCIAMNSDSNTLDLNGYAIAIGKLIDCRKMTPADSEKCFVKYKDNLYCHVYKNVHRIKPFAWKGTQGWKTLTPDQIKQIEII